MFSHAPNYIAINLFSFFLSPLLLAFIFILTQAYVRFSIEIVDEMSKLVKGTKLTDFHLFYFYLVTCSTTDTDRRLPFRSVPNYYVKINFRFRADHQEFQRLCQSHHSHVNKAIDKIHCKEISNSSMCMCSKVKEKKRTVCKVVNLQPPLLVYRSSFVP